MDKLQISTFIVDARESGSERDQIIVDLVGHGLSLNGATKAYAEVSKAEGWSAALVSHKAEALVTLAASYPSEKWDGEAVKAAVIDLVAEYGVAESTARDYCKAYSELLEIPHPITDPREAMFEWLIANAVDGTKDDFKEFAKGLGRSDSNINEYWKGLELHRAIVARS